jgi:AcrR family transcriptional regulator
MRSISTSEAHDQRDLTSRARIRDAALREFGARGFDGATIRGIAEAAGVSPGLVQHHFRSKEALREACDEAVLDVVQRKIEATRDGTITDPGFLAGLYSAAPPLIRYVARAIVDASPAGAHLLEKMATGAEEFLTNTWPDRFSAGSIRTRDAATALVAQAAGTIVLHEYVARRMGIVPWDEIATPRIGLAQIDVYEALGAYLAAGFGERLREAAFALDKRTEGRET